MGDLSAHFDRSEFACKCGCGLDTVDVVLLEMLTIVREQFDVPVNITSGCRCPTYNDIVSGSANSQHLIGRAVDIQVQGVEPHKVQNYVDQIWPDSYGMGRYGTFTHIDSREGKARW